MISRRGFLEVAAATMVAVKLAWAADEVPSMLDHVMLACSDLDAGITFVEEHTGARAVYGGVHPGRGTRNALLSLGEMRYLEIIAPDPQQTKLDGMSAKQVDAMKAMTAPRVLGWAAHTSDIDGLAKKFRDSAIEFYGPWAGSRKRSDGRILNWKTLALHDDLGGLLPFFIQWSADTVHPSKDAPGGCTLGTFAIASPDLKQLSKALQQIGVEAPLQHADRPQLRARINGRGRKLDATS